MLLGDNGSANYSAAQLSFVRTTDPTLGGNDTISGDAQGDILLGGAGSDIIFGGDVGKTILSNDQDIILGDHGEVVVPLTSSVRLVTSVGIIEVVFYDEATPLTVANFLQYASTDAYDGSIFHRSVPGLPFKAVAIEPIYL